MRSCEVHTLTGELCCFPPRAAAATGPSSWKPWPPRPCVRFHQISDFCRGFCRKFHLTWKVLPMIVLPSPDLGSLKLVRCTSEILRQRRHSEALSRTISLFAEPCARGHGLSSCRICWDIAVYDHSASARMRGTTSDRRFINSCHFV